MRNTAKFLGPIMQAFSRRQMFKRAGGFVGAGGALALLAGPAEAVEGEAAIDGLWQGVISARDNSFPPFKTFELYGGSIWISSGQTDLTPAALDSSLWAVFSQIGPRTFRGVGRFWTYSPSAVPTGCGALVQITTVSADGRAYQGQGPLQFFDTNGNPLGPPTILVDNGIRIA